MIILTIRTDKPQAEIGLFNDTKKLAYEEWQAHRELSKTLHQKLKELLKSQGKDWQDIEAIVVFKGPGSFTGLRIGLSVGNALANSLGVPVVSESGEDWIQKAIQRLRNKENETIALPEYGGEVYTTKQKK